MKYTIERSDDLGLTYRNAGEAAGDNGFELLKKLGHGWDEKFVRWVIYEIDDDGSRSIAVPCKIHTSMIAAVTKASHPVTIVSSDPVLHELLQQLRAAGKN